MNPSNVKAKTTEYHEAVAAVAEDIASLAAMLEQPLAVKPEHAALVWTVEQIGGVVDLFTGDIDWTLLYGWQSYGELMPHQQEAVKAQFSGAGDLTGYGYWVNPDGTVLCRRRERLIRNWDALTPWEK